jgi:hypothetical protein
MPSRLRVSQRSELQENAWSDGEKKGAIWNSSMAIGIPCIPIALPRGGQPMSCWTPRESGRNWLWRRSIAGSWGHMDRPNGP